MEPSLLRQWKAHFARANEQAYLMRSRVPNGCTCAKDNEHPQVEGARNRKIGAANVAQSKDRFRLHQSKSLHNIMERFLFLNSLKNSRMESLTAKSLIYYIQSIESFTK